MFEIGVRREAGNLRSGILPPQRTAEGFTVGEPLAAPGRGLGPGTGCIDELQSSGTFSEALDFEIQFSGSIGEDASDPPEDGAVAVPGLNRQSDAVECDVV